MQIIPVIDIKQGLVVHARGGDRRYYPPLRSTLTNSCEPLEVIGDLLNWYPFAQLYVADLDAISSGVLPDIELYRELLSAFPQLTIWLDAGLTSLEQRNFASALLNIRLVFGTETMPCPETLWSDADKTVLSLDYKQGQFLGSVDWLNQPQRWPGDVIVMNLDAVGAENGVNLDLLKRVKAGRKDVSVYAAGGVRSEDDLRQLQHAGVNGALIATALHQGQISADCLMQMEQESRCR